MAWPAPAPHRDESGALPDWFVRKKNRPNLIVNRWVPIALVGAPVLVLFGIVVYPTVWMFYHAFQNTNMMRLFRGNWSYVGWENFHTVLTSERFWDSVQHLVQYLVFGAGLQVLLATVLALTLYEVVRRDWLRVLFLIILVLPMMLPPSIVGVLWKFLLTPSNGAINAALLHFGLIGEHIEWFNAGVSLWSIIIADIWNWTALPLLPPRRLDRPFQGEGASPARTAQGQGCPRSREAGHPGAPALPT